MKLSRDEAVRIFDAVHSLVVQCREEMRVAKSALISDEPITRGGVPVIRLTRPEYIAQFSLCGRHTLFPWKPRWELFSRYFVDGEKYKRIVTRVKGQNSLARQERRIALGSLLLAEGTFNWWCMEIKCAVAPELKRAKLYTDSFFAKRAQEEWEIEQNIRRDRERLRELDRLIAERKREARRYQRLKNDPEKYAAFLARKVRENNARKLRELEKDELEALKG